MKSAMILSALAVATLIGLGTGIAQAGPNCTTEPKDKWMSEEAMKAKVTVEGYKDIRALKVSGSCYELHARTADGKKAEVYFNPVTGAVVERDSEGKEHEERDKE